MNILSGLDLINLVQWPAMAVTIAASWLVASSDRGRRNSGFLLSNGLWVVWALHVGAPALIALQVGLATMNIRGAMKSGFGYGKPSENAHANEPP